MASTDESICQLIPSPPKPDFRSDTVTWPTEEMRLAMLTCKVGDDVLGDEPTVKELEQLAAEVLGKEACIFVPSGTMGNLIAVMVHCEGHGNEMILGDKSHIHLFEGGGSAAIAGAHAHLVSNLVDGTMPLEHIEKAVRTANVHFPVTRLVCLENTQNMCGGMVLKTEYTDQVVDLCKKLDLKLHMDGARLPNAAAKLDLPLKRLVQGCDSVMMCLSKGLAAPVGSVLAGDKQFIAKARRFRKMLGGGMRQSGVLAACGLISLRSMLSRVKEDHEKAAYLYESLNALAGVDATPCDTNLLFFNIVPERFGVKSAKELCERIQKEGFVVMALNDVCIRLALHCQITWQHVQDLVALFIQLHTS